MWKSKIFRIMYDTTIIYDEVIKSYDEEIETIPTNFNKKM